jgi:hypothetical protein
MEVGVTLRLKARDLKSFKGVDLKGLQAGSKFKIAPKSRRTLDGIVFDSASEMRRYAQLKLMEKAGLIDSLERQVPYPVYINGNLVTTYHADFRWRDIAKNVIQVEDVKSPGTKLERDYRLRRRCVEAYYGIRVHEIIMD